MTEEGKGPDVIWRSSDEEIVTVDENGVVSLSGTEKTGWVTISVSCGAVTATCDVLVW